MALCAASLLLCGCSSYETTYLLTDEQGKLVPTTIAGVPIVVTVPQKIGFYATESRYLVENPIVKDGQVVSVAKSYSVETTVDKTPISLGKSQLVNLDIKRPLSGTAETSMELNTAQYPTKLASKVDDKTFEQALSTVEKLIEKQGAPISANASKTLVSQRSYLIVYDPTTQHITRVNL
ncbi:hypothetical protein SE92_25855 [Bradyrhizobium sp. AT1]|nr:hypothetical protein SE92_25855 [Bradyrhizobium sp. AT1]